MEDIKIETNKKISMNIMFFGICMIFIFACNNIYLGITEYYYFPVISIIFSILYFFKKNIKMKLEHWCGIFIIYYIFVGCLKINITLDSGVLLSYVVLILLFLFITLKKVNKREIGFLINCYIISAVIISLNIVILRNEFNGWVNTYRYTLKFLNNTYVDPNFIASFLIVPAIFSFNKIVRKKNNFKIYLNLLIFLLISIAIFLTGSRSALVALALGVILILIYYRDIKSLSIFFISMCLIIIAMVNILPSGTIDRMFINSYLDVSNITRINNWIHGFKAFSKNPILGYGCVDSNTILINVFRYPHAIHNTYITFLVQLGLIGFIPLMIIIIKAIIYSFKKGYRLLIAIIFPLIFASTIIEQNTSITFWSTLIIIYTIINYKMDNTNQKIEDIIYNLE